MCSPGFLIGPCFLAFDLVRFSKDCCTHIPLNIGAPCDKRPFPAQTLVCCPSVCRLRVCYRLDRMEAPAISNSPSVTQRLASDEDGLSNENLVIEAWWARRETKLKHTYVDKCRTRHGRYSTLAGVRTKHLHIAGGESWNGVAIIPIVWTLATGVGLRVCTFQ